MNNRLIKQSSTPDETTTALYNIEKILSDSAYLIKKKKAPFTKFFWKIAQSSFPVGTISTLKSICHPAIVGIYKAEYTYDYQKGVLLYFMENGSLSDMLSDKNHSKFTPDIKMRTIYGIASAYCILHSNNFFLGCLDARHVLFDDYYYPQIVNLCALTQFQSKITEQSSLYLSQNAIKHSSDFCEEDDCYSFGILLYQILTGDINKPVFPLNDSIPEPFRLLIDSCIFFKFDKGDAFKEIVSLLNNDEYIIKGTNVKKYKKYCYACILANKEIQDPDDKFFLAKCYTKRNNTVNWIPILKELVDNEFPKSYLLISQLLIEGKHITQSSQKAEIYLSEVKRLMSDAENKKKCESKYQYVMTLYKYYFQDPNGKNPQILIDAAQNIRDVDKKTAIKYFKKAANDDYPDGMFNYAYYLYKGDGVEKNEEMAKSYLLKAASRFHIPSINSYATILEKEGKLEQLLAFLKRFADLKCPTAMYKYAMAIRKDNPEKSTKYLKDAADLGDSSATMQYASDLKAINDLRGALEYYSKVKGGKMYEAMLRYGETSEKMGDIIAAKDMYMKILGLPPKHNSPDYPKIISETKFRLAVCWYNEGNDLHEAIIFFEEVYKDFPDALRYLIKFAENEKKDKLKLIYIKLAACYGFEDMVKKYYEETKDLEFLKEEASRGNLAAFALYGNVTQDINYIKISAEKGHADSIYLYGCHLDKCGQHKEAIEAYKIAAKKGHLKSNVIVGTAYLNGWSVEKNVEIAMAYLNKAKDDAEGYLSLFEFQNGSEKIPQNFFNIFTVMK